MPPGSAFLIQCNEIACAVFGASPDLISPAQSAVYWILDGWSVLFGLLPGAFEPGEGLKRLLQLALALGIDSLGNRAFHLDRSGSFCGGKGGNLCRRLGR